jgi:DNA segregation ATPase FtsK/SpoIIIE-like protein
MSDLQSYQQQTALTALSGFGRALLGTLDRLFVGDPRAPYALKISRWTYFEDREREALYAGIQLDSERLHHLPLTELGAPDAYGRMTSRGQDTLGKLQLALNGRRIQVVSDSGFWYLIQLQAPRADAPEPARVNLPKLVKLNLAQSPARPLSIPFGVTTTGPQMLDLSEPNHILLAGVTQSGKSSWIQAALVALCSFNPAEAVKLIIIDPKGEFVHWRNTRYLLAPMASDAGSALKLLSLVSDVMDLRRQLFEDATARNLTQYRIRTGKSLPLLVVAVDEFVDLALEGGRAFMPLLTRLASKAASYGIRLILSATSPKAEIVSSTLRQQCGIRLAFRCTEVWQSESVLGQGRRSAASLPNIPGRFVAQLPGSAELLDGQAYYVDDDLLDEVTDLLRAPAQLTGQGGSSITLTDDQRDMIRFALDACKGYFKLREISREFCGTLTPPKWLRDLAKDWEASGLLHKPISANASRKIGEELRKAVG